MKISMAMKKKQLIPLPYKEFNFKWFAGRDFKIAMKVGIFLSLLRFAGDNSNGQAMPPASPMPSDLP